MAFHVGQQVVCVDDSNLGKDCPPECRVVRGQYYTVAYVAWDGIGLQASELPTTDGCFDYYWYCWRFRPLTTQSKTTSFTTGAPTSTEQWDNRKVKVDG